MYKRVKKNLAMLAVVGTLVLGIASSQPAHSSAPNQDFKVVDVCQEGNLDLWKDRLNTEALNLMWVILNEDAHRRVLKGLNAEAPPSEYTPTEMALGLTPDGGGYLLFFNEGCFFKGFDVNITIVTKWLKQND